MSPKIILAIADFYGKTLRLFVHITKYRDADSQTFETFVNKCPHLRTLACDDGTKWQMMLQRHGGQFRELLVCEKRTEFSQASDEGFDFPNSLAGIPRGGSVSCHGMTMEYLQQISVQHMLLHAYHHISYEEAI